MRVGVVMLDRPQMTGGPGLLAVDRDVRDWRAEARVHRDREPPGAVRRLDAIAVLPAVLLVLNGIEEDEEIRGRPFREIAEPRQILRLVDGDSHGAFTKLGLLSNRPPLAARASRRNTVGRPSHASRCVAPNGG